MNIALLSLLLISSQINPAKEDTITLDSESPRKSIGLQVSYIEDAQGTFTISDIQKNNLQEKFKRSTSQIMTFPNANSYYWIKFTVISRCPNSFVLVIDEAKLKYADLYYQSISSGQWNTIRNGFSIPLEQKTIIHNTQVYPLELRRNELTTFYLRIKPLSMPVPLYIFDDSYFFQQHNSIHKLIFGLLLGVILIVSFNNLANYFFSGNYLRLLYFFTSGLFVLYSITFDGYIFFFSETMYQHLYRFLTPLSYLSQLLVVVYGINFLQIKHHSIWMYRWSVFFAFVLGSFTLLSAVVSDDFVHLFVMIASTTGILVLFSCLIMGILTWKRNTSVYKSTALIYTFAYVLFLFSFAFEVAHIYYGWEYVLVVRFVDIGFLCEALGLSFALSVHRGIEKKQLEIAKNNAQAENLFLVAQQNQILEEKVNKRTHELMEKTTVAESLTEKLTTQSEHLKELILIRDRLFSIISHDLRSPLTQLQAVLSLASNNSLSEKEFKDTLALISISMRSSVDLTNNLLYWAKSQMDGVKLTLGYTLLFEVVEKKILFFSRDVRAKEIQIHNQVNRELKVFTDESLISLIIHNLIGNAVKFCNKGDVITIGSYLRDDKVFISVNDTGVGMKPEEIARITSGSVFTKKGTANEKGSGLGLMICKDLIRQLGGELWLESQLGTGTSFYFTIPLVNENEYTNLIRGGKQELV